MQSKNNAYRSLYHIFLKTGYKTFCLSFVLLFFCLSNVTSQTIQSATEFYKKGLKQKENGNYEKALKIWEQAQNELNDSDFRIAQAYIKLVTDKQLKDYYQNASKIYYWGLSGNFSKSEEKALIQEAELLRPLTGFSNFKAFKNKIEEGKESVLQDIKNFWEELDPTPLTSYNERLIEHWERISFARENYSKPGSEELDDRAITYLKYGEPYYTREGQLSYNSSFVHNILKDGIKTPSFASANQRSIASAQRYNLETKVREMHTYPIYEVWLYRNLTDDTQNIIFVFGSNDGSKNLEKMQTVEDFIPSEAYKNVGQHNYSMTISGSSSDRNNSNAQFDGAQQSRNIAEKVTINPALILQLMYYNQLSALDKYFGQSFDRMMDRYKDMARNANSNMGNLAREFGSMYGSKLIHIQSNAPQEKSEDKSEIQSISSTNYTYRFLDEDNDPYLKTYSITNFEDAFYYDLLKETNSLDANTQDKYTLISGYRLKDKDGNNLQNKKKFQNISSSDKKVRVFEIPYNSSSQSLILSHELHDKSQMNDSTISTNTVYANSLKGLRNDEIELPKPLNKNGLSLSDIIIGYNDPSEEINFSKDSLNFTIAHDKVIPQGSDLFIYYEIYNLQQTGNENIAEFNSHFSIRKDSKILGIFNRPDDKKSGITTINRSVSDDRFKNTLSIKTSTLEKGEYKLLIEVQDLNSETDLSKNISFKIN